MKTTTEILTEMRYMMGAYSMEAVYMDGEASRSQVLATQREGRRRWSELTKELSRLPTFTEMYGRQVCAGPCSPEGL